MLKLTAILACLQAPQSAQDQLRRLDFLIGEWSGVGEQKALGAYVEEHTYEPAFDRHFIKHGVIVRSGDRVIWCYHGIIGWDADRKKIVGFYYGMDGTISWGSEAPHTEENTFVVEGRLAIAGPDKEFRVTVRRLDDFHISIRNEVKRDEKYSDHGTTRLTRRRADGWSRWEQGTLVRYKSSIQGKEGGHTIQLGAVGETGYALDESFTIDREEKVRTTLNYPVREREETLRVGGRVFPCVVWRMTGKRGSSDTEWYLWRADEVRVPLKIVIREGDLESRIVAVRLSEEVAAMGRSFVCVRLEGDHLQGTERVRIVVWAHPDVPGWLVKSQLGGTGCFEVMEIRGNR